MAKIVHTCGMTYSDRPVLSAYSPRQVRTSEENGLFLGEIVTKFKGNRDATLEKMASSANRTDALSAVLFGGWMSVTEDKARAHSGQAWKFTTRELTGDNKLCEFSVSVEISTDFTGLMNTVRLVPTVGRTFGACAPCVVAKTEKIKNFDSEYLNKSKTVNQCEFCNAPITMGNGWLLTIAYHFELPTTVVPRACGCKNMEFDHGVVLGDILDVTAQFVIDEIKRLRAYVGSASCIEEIGHPVKAQQQFDAKVKRARNIWTGERTRRDKVTIGALSL